ncbi:MAG TPA: hypothetical protein VFB07_09295 [Vicinamibacterales bacterium]|nr:hypothetical protein [Vicinamibacterales bacterium]
METSVVRNRLRDTIERAKRRAADRRSHNDEASRAYDAFLEQVATPLLRQIAGALKADGYAFTVFTPSGSVRLMSDRRAEDFIEISLDSGGDAPRVIGHTSRLRGRNIVETERPVGSGHPGAISEEEVLEFLLKELEPFVER